MTMGLLRNDGDKIWAVIKNPLKGIRYDYSVQFFCSVLITRKLHSTSINWFTSLNPLHVCVPRSFDHPIYRFDIWNLPFVICCWKSEPWRALAHYWNFPPSAFSAGAKKWKIHSKQLILLIPTTIQDLSEWIIQLGFILEIWNQIVNNISTNFGQNRNDLF